MSTGKDDILDRLRNMMSFKVAMMAAPKDDKEKIERVVEDVASRFGKVIDDLRIILSDPVKAAAVREEIVRTRLKSPGEEKKDG